MIDVPNINAKVDEDLIWRFRALKGKLRAKNNAELIKKLVELGEKVV